MILQSLVEYYDQLCKTNPGDVAQLGWSPRKVAFLIEIEEDGHLANLIPAEDKSGWTFFVPEQVKRSSGIKANLLCDNASYLFGIDAKGDEARAIKCFEASKERHLNFLDPLESDAAQAVFRFFETWDPTQAKENDVIAKAGKDLLAGGNLVFRYQGKLVLDDPVIRQAWDSEYLAPASDSTLMTCLVSGKTEPIAKIHQNIKGLVGAQSSGATLVGFNANAFESYGHDGEQGLNAPVGERAAFAYITALNYLLASPEHRIRLGDTTIVYWAKENDLELSKGFNAMFGGFSLTMEATEGEGPEENPDKKLNAIMKAIERGRISNSPNMEVPFFILGLAPNAARASVRFFLRSTFGEVMQNLTHQYERLKIVHAPFEREYLTPYHLLRETENPNASKKDATSLLGGSLMRSILTDSNYPEALFTNVMLRIHATQNDDDKHVRKVTSGKASIIKAYLLKNRHKTEKEVTVGLNEERNDPPYVLGRLFAVLEAIQDAANPGVNSTIMNRYFDSASVTPATVFPGLIKLAYHHLDKLSREKYGLAVHLRKQLGDLTEELGDFPKQLSIVEQGAFVLGYQHQYQSRFKAGEKAESANAISNGEE